MTPFGDEGPWKDHKASDLIHLALGGIMMNCGYDPDPAKHYDLPPIAPQLWHAYHIAGDQMVVGILAALIHRLHTAEGQDLSVAIHEAVSKNTELDVMSWVMRRAPLFRQTCRHAIEKPTHVPSIGHTKDGRWYIAARRLGARPDECRALPGRLRHGGGPPGAGRRCRHQGTQHPRFRRRRRDEVPPPRDRAALHPLPPLRHHALARGAGRRPAVVAAAQAA